MAKKASAKGSSPSIDVSDVIKKANALVKSREWISSVSDENKKVLLELQRRVVAGEASGASVAKVVHEQIGGDAVVKRSTLEKWLRRA